MILTINKIFTDPDFLLIDGNQRLHRDRSHESVVKSDTKCSSIAAARILAKVSRDRIREEFHNTYSDYGWITNKGYSTPFPRAAISKYGLTPLHSKHFRV